MVDRLTPDRDKRARRWFSGVRVRQGDRSSMTLTVLMISVPVAVIILGVLWIMYFGFNPGPFVAAPPKP